MITTTPVFYYNYKITAENYFLNFDDGDGELAAELRQGNYSATELGVEIARAMSEYGSQDYTVTFDRDTRKYTISAVGSFNLLAFSGANIGLGCFSTIGFAATDLTASTSYESDTSAGSEFIPQFPLQDFIGFDDWQEFAEANINESASGLVEVYSIGSRSFMEFNITLATDYPQGRNGIIRNDANGVSKLRTFMQYCITKGNLEFMPDSSDRSTYSTVLLEKTPTSSTGTGYQLKELYGKGLSGYYETGKLKWRLKE